ncbi:hypothetical protein BH11BAC3_BH11BAC3_15300 [soil metagenome]
MKYLLSVLSILLIICVGLTSYAQVIQASGPTTFCQGGSVTLTVNPTSGVTGYQWLKNGNIVGTGSSVSANSTGSYSVKLSRLPLKDTTIGTQVVTVNPLPVITVNSQSICTGQTAVLNASGANTYSWSPSTGLNTTSGPAVNASPPSTTVYTVTGKSLSTGCANTATATVTVNAYPAANFTFSPSGQCSNVPVTFTNTSTGGGTYSWDFGDINSGTNNASTSANPIHTFIGTPGNGAQNFNIVLTASVGACVNTKSLNLSTTQIPDGTLGGNGKVVYNGEIYFKTCGTTSGDFTFTNQSTTASSNKSYQIVWGDNSPDFTSTNFSSTTHTYSIGSHSILFIVTGPNCVDTTKYFAFVGTNPAVGLNNPGNTVGCSGTSLTFPISGTSTNAPGTLYTVTFNDGSSPINYTHPNVPPSVTHIFTNASCGVISSNGTNTYPNSFSANIMASNPCASSAATVVPIYVSKKPLADFTISPNDSVCINTTVTFNNISSNNYADNGNCLNGNSIWSVTPATGWTLTSGNFGNDFSLPDPSVWQSGSQTIGIKFTIAGVYQVKIKTGNNICGSDSVVKNICVTTAPVPSFTVSNTVGCTPFNISVTNTTTSLNNCSPPSYLWKITYLPAFCGNVGASNFVGGTSSTSPNPFIQFDNPGTYTLTLDVTNACGTFTTSQTINVKQPPTVKITPPIYPCGPVTINPSAIVTSCGTQTPLTYLWTFAGGSITTSTSANPGPVSFSAVGNHTITLAVTNECGTTIDNTSILVTNAPDIVATADKNYCGGVVTATINFSSTIGTPVYNWTNSNPAIGLAASGTGNIPSFTTINNGASPVVATIIVTPYLNPQCSGVADTFLITVNPQPLVPAATPSFIYCLNTIAPPLSASVAAGDTLYWYNNINLTGGSTIAPTPPTNTPAALQYFVTQKNIFGCESGPENIKITVNPAITGDSVASNQNICANTIPDTLNSVNIISGGNGSFTYQWQSSIDAGVTWVNTTVGTGPTYSPPALTATTLYRRIVNSSTCTDTSNVVTITVQGALTNYNITAAQTVCAGSVPDTLRGGVPTGGGGSYMYTWESSIDSITWNSTSGAGLNYLPAALQQTTFFRRKVVASQCSAVSNSIKITVTPLPVGFINAPIKSICVTDAGNILFTATTGTAPFDIEILLKRPVGSDTTLIKTINTSGPASLNVMAPNSAPGRYIISLAKITDSNACVSLANLVSKDTIDIFTPIINVIKNDTIICSGQQVLLQTQVLSGGSTAIFNPLYTYQWESTPLGQTIWQPIPGATQINYLAIPAASTCYRRKVKSNNLCEVISNSVCITVNATISNNIISASQQICINTSPANLNGAMPSGGDNTYFYQWQSSTDSINWNDVATTLNYQPGIYSAAGVNYFRRNVTSGGCTSVSDTLMLTVQPDARAVFTANPTIVCSAVDLGNFISVTPLPANNGLYQWFADGTLFGSNTTGVFPTYSIANPSDTVIIKLITTSPFGCKPDSLTQQFITVPTAVANFTKDTSFGCGPLTVSFINTSNLFNGIQFNWDFGNGIKSNLAQPGNIVFNNSPFFNDTTYQVTLLANNGCGTTVWRDSVKVRSNPKARFGVDTTFGCSPFLVQINNTSPGGPNTYYWDFGNGTTDTTSTNGIFYQAYNVGNVADTLTIRLIAENQCGRDTEYINIRVAPNLIKPLINVNGSQLFGCAPHVVTFNNNTSGASSYTWNFGDNTPLLITNNNQSSIVHTYPNAGAYTVTVDITNGCSDTTVYRQVTVFPKPQAAFVPNAMMYCAGDTVSVNNNSVNATNYNWFWDDGTNSTSMTPAHVYFVAGNYNILLRAERTNASGLVCFDTLVRPVTVLAKPVVTVQSNINTINCAPYTVNVAAPGIINETVTWYFYDSTVGISPTVISGSIAQYTFNKPGSFSLKMIAVNGLGCTDSTIIPFTVRGKAVASFTPGNLNVCIRDTTLSYINTSIYNGTDPISYQWKVDNVLVATSANFTHRYTVLPAVVLPKTFTTSLIVSNTVGCSDTATATLNINPTAKAAFVVSNPNDCVPYMPSIVNNSTYATSYKWLLNGVVVSTNANPGVVLTQGTTLYTISLIADNVYGCKPDTFNVSFTSRARPYAAFRLSDTLGCTGALSVATTNLTTGASTYTWNWGDGSPNSFFKNPTHLFSTQGQYQVTLVASDGVCTDTTQQMVKVSVKPQVNFAVDQALTCDTARVQFTNLSANGANYTWTFGDGTFSTATNPYKSYPPRGAAYTVKLVATSNFGCEDSAVKANLILAKTPPVADFFISPNPVITVPNYTFNYNNLTLNNSSYKYLWSLGDGTFATTRDVTHKYTDTGNYPIQLIVLDTITNCPDTTFKIARIDGFPGYLYVPNAICPQCIQSSIREFLPKGMGLKTYRLQIFTTWGELVFETSSLDVKGSPTQSWDGKFKGTIVQQDVYVWRIDAKFLNGSEWLGMIYPGDSKYKKVGTITVIK